MNTQIIDSSLIPQITNEDIIPSNWLVVTDDKGEVVFNGNNIILQHKVNSDVVGYIENNEHNQALFGIQQQVEYQMIDLNQQQLQDQEIDQDMLDENEANHLTMNANSAGWSHNAIKQLLALYSERKERFRNSHIKKKILWREIGEIMNKSPDDCDKKFRNLKITYIKLLKKKKSSGRQAIVWIYFETLDDIFRDDRNINPELCLNVMSTLSVPSQSSEPHSSCSVVDTSCTSTSLISSNMCTSNFASSLNMSEPRTGDTLHIVNKKQNEILENTAVTNAQPKQKRGKEMIQVNSTQKEAPKKRSKRNQDIKNVLQAIHNRQESLDKKVEVLIEASVKSNQIQEERNNILKALIDFQKITKN